MSERSQHEIELNAVIRALLETVKAASTEGLAMDALLSAYLNVAQATGRLHEVHGALMAVAQHPAVAQACEAKVPTRPSIY